MSWPHKYIFDTSSNNSARVEGIQDLLAFAANLRSLALVSFSVSPHYPNGCVWQFAHRCVEERTRDLHFGGKFKMKTRITIMLLAMAALVSGPAVFAQDHGEAGIFGELFRASASSTNLFGVGGRIGLNIHPNVALEAEGSYDFAQSNTQNVTGINGNTTVFRSDLRATHFLFGPKFQLGTNSPVRAFVFAKGGFLRFGVTPGPVTFGAFPTRLENTDLNGTLYPGGGVEVFLGPIGIRAEAGDEIYFDRGAQNNLKVSVGPTIRF